MSSEGEGAASYTAEIAAIATRERDQIDTRLEALLVELESVRAEKRKIDKVMSALNGSVTKPESKRAPRPVHVSAAYREKALKYITGNDQEITSQKLREALNTSGSQAANILAVFREEGLVRLSATQGNMKIYRSQVTS